MATRGFMLLAAWFGLAWPVSTPSPTHGQGLGVQSTDPAEPRGLANPAVAGMPAATFSCPLAERTEPVPSELLSQVPPQRPSGLSQPGSNPVPSTLLSTPPPAGEPATTSPPTAAEPALASTPEPAVPLPPDYRQRLRPTPLGWPTLKRWCVWVEPATDGQSADRWQQRWSEAVDQALIQWAALLPLQRVDRPEAAQILLLRRRPTRQLGADGRLRASHGRALLSLRQVDRGQGLRLEPLVHVVLSPDQRAEALQATALHELGHGLGLWGHSDSNQDVMASRPGPKPILRLSDRDRATLTWLYSQPTRFGQPLTAGKVVQGVVNGPSQASGEEIKR